MKVLITFLLFQTSFASTFIFPERSILLGEEFYNHKATGNRCFVQLDYVEDLHSLGNHCYKLHVKFGFTTKNQRHVRDTIALQSRVTNYHRVDYPALKSCAEPIRGGNFDGAEIDIYGAETAELYNQIFSWEKKVNKLQQSVHLSFSKETKAPTVLRLHTLNWLREGAFLILDRVKATASFSAVALYASRTD
mgnify:CR=1 FL=1